jgi:integrase
MKANVKTVEHAKIGRHHIEGTTGLYLHVGDNSSRWLFRYHRPDGRPNETGIGSTRDVSLKEAVEQAEKLRALARAGVDPIADKRAKKLEQKVNGKTVRDVLDLYAKEFAARRATAGIVALIDRHAADLMPLAVAKVTTADVKAALATTLASRPKTAAKVRALLSTLFSFAKASGMREGDDPASRDVWRFLVPPPPKPTPYRMMPYPEVPAFFDTLLAKGTMNALALAFAVCATARSGEVLGMTFDELDFDQRLWTCPGTRTKRGIIHRTPLSAAALDVIARAKTLGGDHGYVFKGASKSKLSSRAMEGLMHRQLRQPYAVHATARASFSTWANQTQSFAFEDVEACLAHQIGNSVSRSYDRADRLLKRRVILEAWSDFLLLRA